MVCASRIASTCDNSSCVVSRTWSGAASSHAFTFSFEPMGPPSYMGKHRQAAFFHFHIGGAGRKRSLSNVAALNRRAPRTPQAERFRTSDSEVYPCLATIADVARCISSASLRHSIIIYRTHYRRPFTAAASERYLPRRYSFTRSQKTMPAHRASSRRAAPGSRRNARASPPGAAAAWRCNS